MASSNSMIGECRIVICGGSRHPHAPGNTPAGCRCGGSLCRCGAGCPGTPAAGPKRHSAPHPAAHCTGTRCHGLDTHLADAALHASQHVLTRCRPGWGAANPVCGMHHQASQCWGLRYQCVECISIGDGCRTLTVVTCSLPEQAAALYNQCVECIPTFTVMTCWSPGPAAALRSAMPAAARCAPAGSIQSCSPYMKVTGTWRRTPMECEPGNPVQFCPAAACTARMLHGLHACCRCTNLAQSLAVFCVLVVQRTAHRVVALALCYTLHAMRHNCAHPHLDVFEVVLQGSPCPGIWPQQVPQRVLAAAA